MKRYFEGPNEAGNAVEDEEARPRPRPSLFYIGGMMNVRVLFEWVLNTEIILSLCFMRNSVGEKIIK